MNVDSAKKVHGDLLEVVSDLTKILLYAEKNCSDIEYQQLKRAIGNIIGEIQVDILDPINEEHPHLDDLK